MQIKRVLLGKPIASADEKHQRLNIPMALAVFSSDAISSVAYATEEILIVMVIAGTAGLGYSVPIAITISILFAIVTLSYRQTIMAYPGGGGSYIVAKDNLGTFPGLIAAASLLTDYILTVAVSTSSGVAAITSAFPSLYQHTVLICIGCVIVVVLANLRGAKESGSIFSIPTYFFIISISIMIAVGFFKAFILRVPVEQVSIDTAKAMSPVTIFLILKAFSSGCSALTGIEAISNGIPAFKPPESVNARKTLTIMATICIVFFSGISYLAHYFRITPLETITVVSQLAEKILGRGFLYFCVQFGTALILIMAANTSFADFPRLSAILARAGFMPRQMSNLGDRLVFVNGIIMLGAISILLLIAFKGVTTKLIPLYAVGVFMSFTLSQTGMVVHWLKSKEPGWQKSIIFNTVGAIVTAIVAIVAAVEKFTHGAFIVIILIPVLVYLFYQISVHYRNVGIALRVDPGKMNLSPLKTRVFLPLSGVTNLSIYALRYCLSLSSDVTGIYVNTHHEATEKVIKQIESMNLPIPFKIIDSPYRSITEPLIEFIEKESTEHPDEIITLVIPEFMPRLRWHYFLHNQTAMVIYAAFRGRENIVITSVRKRLEK